MLFCLFLVAGKHEIKEQEGRKRTQEEKQEHNREETRQR